MLGMSTGGISTDIRLAEALNKHDFISKFRTKTDALRYLNKAKDANHIENFFRSEDELQQYLYEHWEDTPFHEDWKLFERGKKFKKGKYDTKEIGEIDLLAKSIANNR